MIDAPGSDSRVGESQIIIADMNDKDSVEWRKVMSDHSSTEDKRVVDIVDLHAMLQSSHDGGPQVELAVTGKAFNRLIQSGDMRRYLLDTRIFARMSPHDKVDCVKLHMERAVTAMCGDGGNDAGALKASHCGIALSEAGIFIEVNCVRIFGCLALFIG